ncbi:DUF5071 domain-containing protein [Caulobacter soli]|uniref:DUF5071 domain-containing protein n=1 Tax=Caulobacter soli TaxID=2708539 RepID=UPI0013EDC6EC|nr:DUF5071 domain-containing protein [Caulobacter soli]
MDPQLAALLPKDKLDTAAIERLSQAGYPFIEPLLSELLTWMQDLNWPVAQDLRPFLADIGAPLAPHIRAVLRTHDDVWKYWTVIGVVAESNPLTVMLRPELKRIANSPTEGEREERIDVVARNILRRLEAGSDESVLPQEYVAHNRQVLGEA